MAGMGGAVAYKHYARFYVSKGAFVSATANNVIGIFNFRVSDVYYGNDSPPSASDTVDNTSYLELIRPEITFTPYQLVMTPDSNNGFVFENARIKLEFELV